MRKSIFDLSKRKLKRVEKEYKKTAFGKASERAVTLTFILILAIWLCELVFNKICNKNLHLDEIDFTGLFMALVTYVGCRLVQLKFIKDFYYEKYLKKYNEYYFKSNGEKHYSKSNVKTFKNQKKWQ